LRGGQVTLSALRPDGVLTNVESCAVAQERRYQVEQANDPGRPDDRCTGRLGIRHGEESDQDVRQTRRSEDEGDVE
jgi:hypothetical protein